MPLNLSSVLPLFLWRGGRKGADDVISVRREARRERASGGLRDSSLKNPLLLPPGDAMALCGALPPGKQSEAISTDKARRTPIYGPAGVLYALCSLYLDPSMDSRAQTPTRPAGLCRLCRIDEAPAHASGLSPPRVRGSSRAGSRGQPGCWFRRDSGLRRRGCGIRRW